LQLKVNALLQLGQQADGIAMVGPMVVTAEVARHQAKLGHLRTIIGIA
jgi:hypothetical protein